MMTIRHFTPAFIYSSRETKNSFTIGKSTFARRPAIDEFFYYDWMLS